MSTEVTLTPSYRGGTGHAGTYYVDTTYTEVHDAAESNLAAGNPHGMLIMQDAWFPSGSYLRFDISRCFLYFDTSVIPAGADVISAELYLYIDIKYTNRTSNIIIQNGQPTYPHNPIVASDYYHLLYSGNGGEIVTGDVTINAWNIITLNDDGKDWINCGGETKLALRVSRDIDSDAPPTPSEGDPANEEGIHLKAKPSAPYSGKYAKLVITYVLIPEVTTQAVSQIGYKCGMGNMTLVSGANVTEIGFEVRVAVDYFGVGGDIAWGLIGFNDEGDIVYDGFGQRTGYLVKRETRTGEFDPGTFSIVLGYADILGDPSSIFNDALKECTRYACRGYATNDIGTGRGAYVGFDTLCYPRGHQDDDTLPVSDIIPIDTELPVVTPIAVYQPSINIIGDFDFPDFVFPEFLYPDFLYPDLAFPEFRFPYYPLPDFIRPDIGWPEFDYPAFEASLEGSWIGGLYYRKAFAKKDLDDLRRKCRVFQDNSVEYALVLRHNSEVLRQFLNDMHDYAGYDEYNTFKPVIPSQHLNELARKRLTINDFKRIINDFIRNSVDNAISINHNFKLIANGLQDPYGTYNVGFVDVAIGTRQVREDNPDVERLKKVIDSLNEEAARNYAAINHNLKVMKATLL